MEFFSNFTGRRESDSGGSVAGGPRGGGTWELDKQAMLRSAGLERHSFNQQLMNSGGVSGGSQHNTSSSLQATHQLNLLYFS